MVCSAKCKISTQKYDAIKKTWLATETTFQAGPKQEKGNKGAIHN
jgi:hypothetical protein